MELNDIYKIADALIEQVEKGEIKKEALEDITINVKVPSHILYGIDKEFYKLTHDGNTTDFKHKDEINAMLYGLVNFKINKKL